MLDSVDRESEGAFEERVDPERMREHVEAFAGLDRLAGTADEREAAAYIVETMESYGVDAELLEHEAYVSRPGEASLSATAPTPWTAEEVITVAFGASTPPAASTATWSTSRTSTRSRARADSRRTSRDASSSRRGSRRRTTSGRWRPRVRTPSCSSPSRPSTSTR
jgi:hypothetical protein